MYFCLIELLLHLLWPLIYIASHLVLQQQFPHCFQTIYKASTLKQLQEPINNFADDIVLEVSPQNNQSIINLPSVTRIGSEVTA